MSVKGASQRIDVDVGPNYRAVVVYAPRQAASNFICFEPMASITDALNLTQRGLYKDLQSIAPGQTWEERFLGTPVRVLGLRATNLIAFSAAASAGSSVWPAGKRRLLQQERDHVRRLRRLQRAGLVRRHRPVRAIEQIAQREIDPVDVEFLAGERGRLAAAGEIVAVAARARVGVDLLSARGLRRGVDAVERRLALRRDEDERLDDERAMRSRA